MKVAVCFSGCVRSMPELVQNHRDCLLSLYDCDVYFSFWDHWGMHSHRDTNLPIDEQRISEYWKKKLVELYNPVSWEYEDFNNKVKDFELKKDIFKDSPNFGDINTFSMYYKIQKCFNLLDVTGKKYDVILRMRSDIQFKNKVIFKLVDDNKVYTNLNPFFLINGSGTNDQIAYGNHDTMRKQSKMYDNMIIAKQRHIITSCLHPETGVKESYKLEGIEDFHDENLDYDLIKLNSANYYKNKLHVIFNTNEKNLPIANLAMKYFIKHNAPNLFNLTLISNRFPENIKHPVHDSRWNVNYISGDIGFCPSGSHFGPTITKALNQIKEDYVFFFCDDYIVTEHIEFEKLNTLLHMMEKEHIDFFSFASSEPIRYNFEKYKVKSFYNIDKDKFFILPQNFRHSYSVQPCIWNRQSLLELLKHNPYLTLHGLDNSSIADKSGYYRKLNVESNTYEEWPNPQHNYNFKMLCTSHKIFDLCCPPEKYILQYREVIRHGRFHIKENGYNGVENSHGQEFITRLIKDERLEFIADYAKYLPTKNDQTGVNS